MSDDRHVVACPFCRRTYTLRVDPTNLAEAAPRMRCGRCKKRFRLAAALAANEAEPSPRGGRGTYRKRISHSAMQRVTEKEANGPAEGEAAAPRPGKLVDDMALALERALRERRRISDPALSATEAELPMEDDGEVDAGHSPSGSSTEKRKTPAVFRFTPPPVAQEILFRAASKRTTTKPQLDATPPTTPDIASGGPVETAEGERAAGRSAWLDFIDEPLDGLTEDPSDGVAALRWLLAEDTLVSG